MSTLPERIEAYKKALGFRSISALAKAADIPSSTLFEVMNGRTETLSAKNAQKLASCVGVTVDEVMGVETEKTPDAEAPRADEKFEKIWAMYSALSDSEKEAADRYLAFLLETQKNN